MIHAGLPLCMHVQCTFYSCKATLQKKSDSGTCFAFQNGRKHTQLLSEKQILLRALVTRDEVKMTFGLVKITTPWGKFTPIAVFSLQKCFLQGKNYHALRKIYPYGCIFSELGVHFPQGVVIFTRPKVVFTWSPVASVPSKNCFSRSKNCFSESSWVCFLPSATFLPDNFLQCRPIHK